MASIVLFGEVLADIFPDKTVMGGAPYNVTRHLRALQQNPTLISRAGHDSLKDTLLQELATLDINTTGIQFDKTKPTGQVTVNMSAGHHQFDILADQAYDYIALSPSTTVLAHQKPDIIYFGTLAQRNPVSSNTLKTLLAQTSCTTFLDLNLRAPWYNKTTIAQSLLAANIVKMNDEELALLSTLFELNFTQHQAIANYLIQAFNITTLYVTCGKAGAWAYTQSGQQLQVAGKALDGSLVDTVGAGDAFSAVCLVGHLHDWPLKKTLDAANSLATDLCKVRGAAPKTNHCYSALIRQYMTA